MKINDFYKLHQNITQIKSSVKSLSNNKVKDYAEISNTAKVYDKIDSFLNLGNENRLDLSDLNASEKQEFYKILGDLIKRGIIGYEYLEVDGKKEKHFITNRIGDERTYGARRWKNRNYFKPKQQR